MVPVGPWVALPPLTLLTLLTLIEQLWSKKTIMLMHMSWLYSFISKKWGDFMEWSGWIVSIGYC